MPAVGDALLNLGWRANQIHDAIDFSGIQWCLQALNQRNLYVAVNGTIVHGDPPANLITLYSILWGQSRKLYGKFSDVLQSIDEQDLRDKLSTGPPRHLARLNSCSGQTSGKWLSAFPSSWWPSMSDDVLLWHYDFDAEFLW